MKNQNKLFIGTLHIAIFILLVNLASYVYYWTAILIPVYLIYILVFVELKFRFYATKEKEKYMFGIVIFSIIEILRLYIFNN